MDILNGDIGIKRRRGGDEDSEEDAFNYNLESFHATDRLLNGPQQRRRDPSPPKKKPSFTQQEGGLDRFVIKETRK